MASLPPPGPPMPMPSDMPAPGGAPPGGPPMPGAPPPGMGAPPLDPSALAGLLGPPPSADRSNELMAGILSAVAAHLSGAPPDSGKALDMGGEPGAEKKPESKGSPEKKSEKKSPSSKESGSKKPPSKKASSK